MRPWPDGGTSRVPYWVYTDPDVYRREQERIFQGPTWNYVALAAEVPEPGDFTRTTVGEVPVVVTRDRRGELNAVVNRCAHRGLQFCVAPSGHTTTFTCPYHQWSYDLTGRLLGVPFKKGVNGHGGMPADFVNADHGLARLRVAERHGVVFASFDADPPLFEEYLGATNLGWFDRVFDGRTLRVLGYQRQRVPANWKLMFENIKDPYHASLLHVFLVTFGLFRADSPSATQMDPTGQHSVLVASRGEQRANAATAEMASFRADLRLAGPELLDVVREFPGAASSSRPAPAPSSSTGPSSATPMTTTPWWSGACVRPTSWDRPGWCRSTTARSCGWLSAASPPPTTPPPSWRWAAATRTTRSTW